MEKHTADKETPMQFKHGYALLVGVGADLPVTIQDAGAIRDILIDSQRCGYPPEQVKLLTEAQATRQGVLAGLDWLTKQVQINPEATAIVYFSGHGGFVTDYHLLPYGYNSANLDTTAISGAEFSARLNALQVKKLLILLDCCLAGGMVGMLGPGFTKSPVPPDLESMLMAGCGRVLIASSRRDEYSYTGLPYSVFTQALREGLAGYGSAERDGFAYVADVAMYVGRMVPQRTKDKQHPILKLAEADNFRLAYYAAGAKTPKPLAESLARLLPLHMLDAELFEGYRDILRTYQKNLLLVESRVSKFIDQATVPLDLERTQAEILRKIAELEARINAQTQGGRATTGASEA